MNIMEEIGKFTSGITDTVTGKAKDSAIATLNDPEFKASVNKFTRDWFNEHKIIISAIVGSCLILSLLAIVNILTSFRSRR